LSTDQPPAAPKHDPLAALRQPAFAFYSGSRIFSSLGQQLLQAVMAWQVYDLTGSALSLGILGLLRFIPALTLSLVAGVVADRFDRRRIAQVTQIVPFSCALVLAFGTSAGWITADMVYGTVFLLGLASAFEAPARTALLTGIVKPETFANAVTVNNIFQKIGSVTGPTAAGVIIATAGVSTAYASFCFCAAVAWIALALVPYKQQPNTRKRAGIAEIKEGVRFVRERQVLWGAMTLDMVAVVFGGAAALLPVYAKDILDSGSTGYGILSSSMQVGGLVATFIIVARPPVERTGRLLLICVAAFGVLTIGFGFSRIFLASVVFYGLLGAFDQTSVVLRQTIFQLSTPDELRGRVTSVAQVFVQTSNQLGAVESGFVAAVLGATFAVVSGGVVAIVAAAVVALTAPQLLNHRTSHSVMVAPVKDPDDTKKKELAATG
jgi:MFS family permease